MIPPTNHQETAMTEENGASQPAPVESTAETVKTQRKGRRPSRLTIIVIVGLVLIGILYALKPSVGSGPAGPAVPQEPFQKVWTERPVLLLGLGDSITQGFGASAGMSYFDRLHKEPPEEFPEMRGRNLSAVLPHLTARNVALPGSTSHQHVEDQVPYIQEKTPDVFGIVVMTTGGNDIIHNYGKSPPEEGAMYGATLAQAGPWIANFEKRLDEMLTAITSRFPRGCEIFLGNIYDPTDGTGSARMAGLPSWPDGLKVLAAYNKVIQRVSDQHRNVHLVDLHSLFTGHGVVCRFFWRKGFHFDDPHFWYGVVFEDPNDRGYDATRRAFLIEMCKVFQGFDFGNSLAEDDEK
jgi:lysophospholipase L1-like esterase